MSDTLNKTPPCKDCQDRRMGCHSKCELYTEWKKKFQDIQTQLYRHKMEDKRCRDYEMEKAKRMRKTYGR